MGTAKMPGFLLSQSISKRCYQSMEAIFTFLDKPTVTLFGQTITLGQWILVPCLLVVGFILAGWGIRAISNRLIAKNVDANIVHLVRRVFYILAIIVLAITTLDLINVPLTAFAFVSGAVAIGVGFGAQNIINNFISGWILMWERPIRIGDFLEIDAAKGTVEAINTRSTRIRRTDGVHMLIPNSKLLENTVVNWTLIDRQMRTFVRVGIAYGSPAKKAAQLILQAVEEQADIMTEPKPVVLFEDFGDSALIFDANLWVNATAERDLRLIRSNIRYRIDELFAENDIVIALPQRHIHVQGQLSIKNI